MSNVLIPPTLLEHLSNRLCVPWCGAGVSIPAGLPSWSGLVQAMVDAAKDNGLGETQLTELKQMVEARAYEDVIDFCRDFLGEGEYRTFLERFIGTHQTPATLHELAIQLPTPAMLTSNYDRLLETALTRKTNQLPVVLTADDTQTLWRHFAKGEFFLLKVHGDIMRPNTVVLTSRDYTQHVFGNLPFMTFMQKLLLSHSVLFFGSSLSDIYMKRILEEITFMTGGVGMPHYALLPYCGPIRAKLLRERYNITAISYDPMMEGSHDKTLASILERIIATLPSP